MSEDHELLGYTEIDLYEEMEALIKKNPRAWQSVCAVAALAGAVLTPFLGAAFDITTWFAASQALNSRLHVLSIVSCALTLPLLMLGAFCLDSLEARTARLSAPAEPADDQTIFNVPTKATSRRAIISSAQRSESTSTVLRRIP